jgi:hypothetical protein
MALQYVILEHVVNGQAHFDLMLEMQGQERLRTLQLPRWPLNPGESCPFVELAPHRRAYLAYEGEISGGRGVVRRVQSGVWSENPAGEIVLGPGVRLAIQGATLKRQYR